MSKEKEIMKKIITVLFAVLAMTSMFAETK